MKKSKSTGQSNFPLNKPKAKGGRTTNSPPQNVKTDNLEDVKVLASNVDYLVLAVDVFWNDTDFLNYLEENKAAAKKLNHELPIEIPNLINEGNFLFNLKEHGSKGYEWLLHNHEYALMIGNWTEPISRPSILITIRSEILWRLGPKEAVSYILDFIKSVNGKISSVKLSRIDLCVDILIPEIFWNTDILDFVVSRCKKMNAHFGNKKSKLQTIEIGTRKSPIMARLYDKPQEIKERSKKEWMYDVWKLKSIPKGMKIIRIEYQLRREIIKQFGLNQYEDLYKYYPNVWASCTKEWLSFRDNPGKHQKNQRKVLSWWRIVQNGFKHMQDPDPLIRFKASKADEKQLVAQAFGHLTSLQAHLLEKNEAENDHNPTLEDVLSIFPYTALKNGKCQEDFRESVKGKRAKFIRNREKQKIVNIDRGELFDMNKR